MEHGMIGLSIGIIHSVRSKNFPKNFANVLNEGSHLE